MHILYCIKLQLLDKQNPVIPYINSSANIILYYMSAQIVFVILSIIHIFEKHVEV